MPTPRPINPVVAQKISTTNESATQMSADISLIQFQNLQEVENLRVHQKKELLMMNP